MSLEWYTQPVDFSQDTTRDSDNPEVDRQKQEQRESIMDDCSACLGELKSEIENTSSPISKPTHIGSVLQEHFPEIPAKVHQTFDKNGDIFEWVNLSKLWWIKTESSNAQELLNTVSTKIQETLFQSNIYYDLINHNCYPIVSKETMDVWWQDIPIYMAQWLSGARNLEIFGQDSIILGIVNENIINDWNTWLPDEIQIDPETYSQHLLDNEIWHIKFAQKYEFLDNPNQWIWDWVTLKARARQLDEFGSDISSLEWSSQEALAANMAILLERVFISWGDNSGYEVTKFMLQSYWYPNFSSHKWLQEYLSTIPASKLREDAGKLISHHHNKIIVALERANNKNKESMNA